MFSRERILPLIPLLFAWSCATPSSSEGPAPVEAPPEAAPVAAAPIATPVLDPTLPPRKAFSGNPDFANVQVSPSGKTVAYLAPFEGVLNVWTAPIDRPSEAKPLTKDKDRPVRMYTFAENGKHLLYMQDKGGDENFHVFAVDLATGAARDLTDLPKVRAMLLASSWKKPNEIVVGLNDRDPRFHDLYRIDLATGKRSPLFQNVEGFAEFTVDLDHRLRIASKMTPAGGAELFEVDSKGQARSFLEIPQEDALTTAPLGFDASGKTLFLSDSRGRNTSGIFAFDLAKKKSTLVLEDARVDLDQALTHPKTGAIQAVKATYERAEWKVVDPALKPHLELLRSELKGDIDIPSRSRDDAQWIVVDVVDSGSVRSYRYDTKQKKLTPLFVHRKALEELKLAKMSPRVITSGDGLPMVSYLTVPPASDPDGDGRPSAPLPMVLFVHGGPWARDFWGYNPVHQWLASRGYAVLSVNYRGSTGFGKSFTNAANGEWAGKMHQDLIDAVSWAIKEQVADPKKVAILGGSYGGYSTLVGLTYTPETFACGVDIVGPSNLVTLLETIPPYWAPALSLFITRLGGDHRTEEGKKFLASRSPLSFVDRIKRPLLIGQGANDPRVKQAESDQIVKAMQAKSIPVTYVLFPDEGHGFARPENRLAFDSVSEAFLAQCLGGKYQAIGEDFKGSTITVPSGAGGVVGLSEALAGRGASAQAQ